MYNNSLLIIIIITTLIIGMCINKSSYFKTIVNLEHFYDTTSSIQDIPIISTIPTNTNIINNAIDTTYNFMNDVRFKNLDNQQRLSSISERMRKINLELATTSNNKPIYNASGTLSFY